MWLRAAMFTLAIMALVACKDDDTTPAPQPDPEPAEEPVKTAAEVLSEIPGVTLIKDTVDVDGNSVTFFYFKQPIDHEDASAGTFQQYCALHYKGPDHVTVLHSQGYSTVERKEYKQLHLAPNLDANYIEVEHRYYKRSLINFVEDQTDCTGDYWDYNTAAQSTADLHAVVTALKGTGGFKNKWVSTGVSKNGILTALYAYFYPNEMDLYVPFCAPFCAGNETEGIGKWLTQQCGLEDGKDTELRKAVWDAFLRIATDVDLQKEMAAIYNLEHNTKYTDEGLTRYLLFNYMAGMFYKFCYRNPNEWDALIPSEKSHHSAEIYYRFAMLGKEEYQKNLNELREVMSLETMDIDTEDDDSEYMMEDMEDFNEEPDGRRAAPQYLKLDNLLAVIYGVHAAKELGYFLYDFSMLPADHPLTEGRLIWLRDYGHISRFTVKYGVSYDGGKLMNGFLDFVKNNRYKDKCKMIFIYGGNDPWTGAAIPDPAPDDPYVKKHLVPKGIHSGWINNTSHYPVAEKEWIMNTVKEMLELN